MVQSLSETGTRRQVQPEATAPEGMAGDECLAVVLNGERYETPLGSTVRSLIANLGLAEDRVAVELDSNIVKRELWAQTQLRENARLEVVHFVGGG